MSAALSVAWSDSIPGAGARAMAAKKKANPHRELNPQNDRERIERLAAESPAIPLWIVASYLESRGKDWEHVANALNALATSIVDDELHLVAPVRSWARKRARAMDRATLVRELLDRARSRDSHSKHSPADEILGLLLSWGRFHFGDPRADKMLVARMRTQIREAVDLGKDDEAIARVALRAWGLTPTAARKAVDAALQLRPEVKQKP